MEWNKVWAIGKNTYIRFYPNFGFGLKWKNRRIAWSIHNGFKSFQRDDYGRWVKRG